ncbi:MAG: acyl-CoA dehydrogenase family protein [Thermodesulfobacteriota bacterium]|nr:acyl-CoA dehydrogenase family protein [Thermodesulfobacteriota bacterium]
MSHFNEEQRMIQEMVSRLMRDKIVPLAKEADLSGHSSPEIVRLLSKNGLLKMALPEQYGGIGANYTTIALVVEEMARVDASTAMIFFVTQSLTQILKQWGSEEQKGRFFGEMSVGDKINAFSLTEPNYGSESASIQTRAILDGDHFIINGTKIFVTNADIADFILVFVRTGGGERQKGLSALVVEKDTPGLSLGKHEDKLGLRGSDLSELIFENAEVPRENLLGKLDQGFDILTSGGADMRAYGPGAMAVGLAQGALDYAVSYARQRVQFGGPIANLQAIRFMLADMSIQVEAARALLYRTTVLLDSSSEDKRMRDRFVSATKCFASDTAMRVTTDAVQILGGYGVMKDYPVERMMRDAKMIQIFDGTNQIQRVIVARSLLS